MPFRIALTPSARRGMKRLPKAVTKRVGAAIDALAEDPRPAGCVKLAGENGVWRIRVGDYRVVYEIQDQQLIVLVVRLAHRKDIYRRGNR